MLNSITVWLKQLFHHHEWEVVKEGDIRNIYEQKLGYYISKCKVCGKHKKEDFQYVSKT